MAQPIYTYDPVTQTYKEATAQDRAQAQPRSGLSGLYELNGSQADTSSPGPGISMSTPGVAEGLVGLQNLSLDLQSLPSLTTQAMGQMGMGVAGAFGMATPSPVANPTAPEVTAIAPNPTFGLAAMNAQTAAQNQAQAQQAAVASTAESVAQDVADFADNTDAEAGAAAADATDNGGGGPDGDAGGGAGPGGPSGDSTDAGDSDDDSYAKGGVTSLAKKVQKEGRGQDKMLVHMTPKEVAGLQYLAMQHGGSLTINPRTGLPEAGFLSSILPVVAGAALNAAVPGLGAAMGGFAIPALVGGASYLANPKQGLMGGLMAGLGAYGGMGLGNALGAAATTSPALTGTAAGLGNAGAETAFQVAQSNIDPALLETLSAQQVATAPAVTNLAAGQSGVSAAMTHPQFLGEGVKALGTEAGRTAALQSLGGPMGAAKTLGMAAAPMLAGGMQEEQGTKQPYEAKIRPFTYDPGRKTEEPGFQYRTGQRGESTAEQTYFAPTFTPVGVYKPGTEPVYGTYAGGGITALKHGGMEEGGYVVAADVVSHLGNGSTKAGQKLLKRKLGGVPLNGAGDGMSDSIPTHIEGKQPARVADGEVYIPPGRANPEALDKMMKRIRKAKTGKSRQAPEMNTAKFIPA